MAMMKKNNIVKVIRPAQTTGRIIGVSFVEDEVGDFIIALARSV